MSEKHFISIENMDDEQYTPPLGFTRDEIIKLNAIYNVVASKDCVAEKGCLYVVQSGLPLGENGLPDGSNPVVDCVAAFYDPEQFELVRKDPNKKSELNSPFNGISLIC